MRSEILFGKVYGGLYGLFFSAPCNGLFSEECSAQHKGVRKSPSIVLSTCSDPGKQFLASYLIFRCTESKTLWKGSVDVEIYAWTDCFRACWSTPLATPDLHIFKVLPLKRQDFLHCENGRHQSCTEVVHTQALMQKEYRILYPQWILQEGRASTHKPDQPDPPVLLCRGEPSSYTSLHMQHRHNVLLILKEQKMLSPASGIFLMHNTSLPFYSSYKLYPTHHLYPYPLPKGRQLQ